MEQLDGSSSAEKFRTCKLLVGFAELLLILIRSDQALVRRHRQLEHFVSPLSCHNALLTHRFDGLNMPKSCMGCAALVYRWASHTSCLS